MNNTHKGLAALSVLLLVGAGCSFIKPPEPTDDTMMEKQEENQINNEGAKNDEATMKENDAMVDVDLEGSVVVDTDAMMKEDEKATEDDTAMMEKQEDTAMTEGTQMVKGSYEAYAPEKLSLANSGDVVLFFHASWCPTCKALDTDVNENASNIPDGLTILKVDYDTQTALKQTYGVTYQHTLVQVDANGNMITKWSGGNTLESIVNQVQ